MSDDTCRTILEIAHNGFVTLDSQGRVLAWNPRAAELFGRSREEVLGSDFAELCIPVRYREAHRCGLRRFISSTNPGEDPRRMSLEALRRDGTEFPFEMTVTGIETEAGLEFHAWIRDVSEQRELLQELEAQLRGGHPGMAEILDSLAEAVTIRDAHHHILYANRTALESLGFASVADLQRRPPRSIFADYIVHAEDGRELTMEDIPSVRLLSGEPAEQLVLKTTNRSTGRVRWSILKSRPLHNDQGEAVAAVTIIENITREKAAELRDKFLARATGTLMSSLDYAETLRNVAWLAVPEIADWCAVDLVDERGVREQVVAAHSDPAKLALAERVRQFEPPEPDPASGVGRVLRTGIAELYRDIPDEMLVRIAVNDEHLQLLRELGFRSVLMVPLRARGRTLGAMSLVTAESFRRLDEADKEFAEQLASRAAVAVDNARLATSRREIAHTLQLSLLPDVVPSIDGWEVATMYRAARAAEEVEVGGDFYDFLQTEAGWIVLLGDVTGKGVEAAAMTSLVRHAARFLSKHERMPSRIIAGLNEALHERSGLWLCSALCVRLASDHVVFSSAGHPLPLIVRNDGRIREFGGTGPILGAWTGVEWEDRSVTLTGDETLFVYTDGVTDTPGQHERFGSRRLRQVLSQQSNFAPGDLLRALEAALELFQIDAQADDTAALALRPAARAGPLASPSRTGSFEPASG